MIPFLSRLLGPALLALALLPLARPAAASPSGTPFFLLSDASFGSADEAAVRLEAQNLGAVHEYGGVDVYVYRIKDPIEFLRRQKNLHRIDTRGDHVGEGVSNALSRIWDRWWLDSRTAWRKLFTADARQAVTAQVPQTRSHPLQQAPTPTALHPEYRPLRQHVLVDSFRYPVQAARPIQPPPGVKLAGSSSEFIASPPGNVMVPLGRRAPGLYLVEAMVGKHRAATLVFVSDAIAVTKVSARQMLVWVADRRSGAAVADARTLWTDGVGVLASGSTDRRGVAVFERDAPEKTYVFGQDPKGGVFVAENFYYDSEIYNTKIYAVTDRPLYRPGETVFVKFLGREFRSARESVPMAAGDLKLEVFDPNGFPVAGSTLRVTPGSGGDTSFRLPDNAAAGGYELRFTYKGDLYGAAFRVADYQKPHFEIHVLPDKRDYRTNEEIRGRIQLAYPDGKPVANARVELTVRAQQMTMVEGDLGYGGQFPLQLTTAVLATDARGVAPFVLPAAAQPSRYVVSVLATDGAAYRVRSTREILVERSVHAYALRADRGFSAVGEAIPFTIRNGGAAAGPAHGATDWEWVRLENRHRSSGKLPAGDRFSLTFAEAGTYTLTLRDAGGNVVAAATHYVSGPGVGAPQGSIGMVFDKPGYRPGEKAVALITFPQPVDQALLTIERDRVEKAELMSAGGAWVSAARISPTQWRAEIPVVEEYGPNVTFSVAFVRNGEYVFQNLGLRVAQPRVEVSARADKAVYAPGEKVTIELDARVAGRPAAGALLAVGVVDEMVYVLQPEIAPDIAEFFHHPRRNNVRTASSLSFISYDLARPPSGQAIPARRQIHERAIKVLERPRRDDKDTAFWSPAITADAAGRARISFTMPDALTRWRVTVRAMLPDGTVGQSVAHVRSDKEFYAKWTSPAWLRAQDRPQASVALFNQGSRDAAVVLAATGAGLNLRETRTLRPGINFVSLPLNGAGGDNLVTLTLSSAGRQVDALTVPLRISPLHLPTRRSLAVPVAGRETPLRLPADAAAIRVQLAAGAAAHFRRLMDDLIDYPYGCVEQTASRLLPYSLAVRSLLPGDERLAAQLTQRLHSHRFRLAQMAGPQATFGWWSVPEKDGDLFLTAYAYHADWHASDALRLQLPPGHFDRLLALYRDKGDTLGAWHRALVLSWMHDLGLPVRSLAEALAEQAAGAPSAAVARAANPGASQVFVEEDGPLQAAMARLLAAHVVARAGGSVPAALRAQLDAAAEQVRRADAPVGHALLLLTGRRPPQEAGAVLERVRAEMPTIDRALVMLWTWQALGGRPGNAAEARALRASMAAIEPAKPWQAQESASGQRVFAWPGRNAPASLALASAPPAGTTAIVQYDSSEPEKSTLPVRLERRLYRLVRVDPSSPAASAPAASAAAGRKAATPAAPPDESAAYRLEPVAADAPLRTDALYLDEIRLRRLDAQGAAAGDGRALHYGIVEVPLPPGAAVERTTWGISLLGRGGADAAPLERAHFQETPLGYAVPVEQLQDTVVVRHLLRASQAGRFALPPARYYRMYQPDRKAIEEKHRALVEIR